MLEWLDYEGDTKLVEPDMMKEGKFGSVDLSEGNLLSTSMGNMVDGELITSFSCGKGKLNDGTSVSGT